MPDGVVGRLMAPKDVCILLPGTHEYVKLQGKRSVIFTGVIKDVRMGDYPALLRSPLHIHQGPHKREAGGPESEREI